MPVSVTAALQCLTDEAARAMKDAVAVARRRCHVQTTSLHTIYAFLSLRKSILRDACLSYGGNSYTARLQLRALELSLGIGLDRLATSKSEGDPPISNSLSAAIKRSQGHQRRNPDNYHLQQIHCNQQAALLKVEMKYLIIAILDDPLASRVFADAGYSSCGLKLEILQPPIARISRPPPRLPRCPPIFLCNLTDSFLEKIGEEIPFGQDDVHENCRRIGEVLVRRNEKNGKNPLLVGFCANHALQGFVDTVNSGKVGVFPREIDGLDIVCIGKEINKFLVEKGSLGMVMLKFKELETVLERCLGPGVAVNVGELKAFVGDDVSSEAATFVVSKLTSLLKANGQKLWLIGAATSYETYLKFLAKFPGVDKDWDLHLLPGHWKASFLGSFVPFGGFFYPPPDLKNPGKSNNEFSSCCYLCTEKFEQEVAAILKLQSTVSLADQHSENLPSWLRMKELDAGKGVAVAKAKDDGMALNAKIMELQKKWNDICQSLHKSQLLSKLDLFQMRSQAPFAEVCQFAADRNAGKASSSKNPLLNIDQGSIAGPGQKISPPRQNTSTSLSSEADPLPLHISKNQQRKNDEHLLPPHPLANLTKPAEHTSHSSLTSVTTDLGLGTMYATTRQEADTPKSQEHLQRLSGYISAEVDAVSESTSPQVVQSSSCSGSYEGEPSDPRDYKTLRKALAEKVGWQNEAISRISQAVTNWRSGNQRQLGSNCKEDIWLTLLGPDEVGKRKIASALAEIVFGSQENLFSVDLSSEQVISEPNSTSDCQNFDPCNRKFRAKHIVDYIARELKKKRGLVVFLKNVDKADPIFQNSLSKAISTGRFPDSHNRDSSTNNAIFVTTSRIVKGNNGVLPEKRPVKFSEETILGAKSWQMQILVNHGFEGVSRSSDMNVKVSPMKESSNTESMKKRKLIDTSNSPTKSQKQGHNSLRSYLDLNLPADGEEEDFKSENSDSDSISEGTETWLDGFFDQVDEKVVFKRVNFDLLAEKIVKEIRLQFQRTLGFEALLEIDHEVMIQLVAATWFSDRKRVIGDWVENVLGRSFNEVRLKHHLTTGSVVKLVACEDLLVEEQAPGISLPTRINV
ncbi:Protein SMAX1-LIKE like [Melia azedarach]|nr:Protein SMAX1-LIKE like [Melia azedarach]